MMKTNYHILNGDSLKEQFPGNIPGEIIIARECLVDGEVEGNDLKELFRTRATFISQNYGGTEEEYYETTVPEFNKMLEIESDSDINLWFEDDLFCQVNFWFVAHLLANAALENNLYLVRPPTHTQYGFAGLTNSELVSIYEERVKLEEIKKIASLWPTYQNDHLQELLKTAQELEAIYPFIQDAVRAHIDRIPGANTPGRPIQSLLSIMKELKTEEFGPVFKEFNKREYIYGFGDIQVKRLFDEIVGKGGDVINGIE